MKADTLQAVMGLFAFIIIGFLLVEYYFDDTPTEQFTKEQLEKKGATKIINIFDRSEKSKGWGRQKVVLYNYRGFNIEKNIEINGKKVPHKVNGQIRCYPDFRTWNPFDSEPQETYCQYHEINRSPIKQDGEQQVEPQKTTEPSVQPQSAQDNPK